MRLRRNHRGGSKPAEELPPPPPLPSAATKPDPWLDPLLVTEEYRGLATPKPKRRELLDRIATLEAYSAHRREQVSQLATVVTDLQISLSAVIARLEQLELNVPGKCGSCGKVTDSPDMLYCHEDCRRSWVERQLREGKTA